MKRVVTILAFGVVGLVLTAGVVFSAAGNGNWEMEVIRQSSDGMRISCRLPEATYLLSGGEKQLGQAGICLQSYTAPDGSRKPALTSWLVLPPGIKGELSVEGFLGDSLLPVILGKPVIWRGVRLAPLVVKLGDWWEGSLTLDVKFAPDADGLKNSERALGDILPEQARILSRIALNPPRNLPPRRDLAAGFFAHILLLYPEALDDEAALQELDAFIEWKERLGFKVTRVAVDAGALDAEDIRELIADYYLADPPVDYLIIVGDDRFPDPYIYDHQRDAVFDEEMFFPGIEFVYVDYASYSDLLLTTMDGGNDLIPDIPFGRFWVPTTAKLANVLHRTVEYELNPYSGPEGDDAWYGRALLAMESDSMFAERVDLVLWAKRRLLDNGYQDVSVAWNQLDPELAADEETEALEAGVSLMLAHGAGLGMLKPYSLTPPEAFVAPAATGRMHPFIVASSPWYDTWLAYEFFASGSIEEPNGPIAALTMTHKDASLNITSAVGAAAMGLIYDGLAHPGDLTVLTALQMTQLLAIWNDEADSSFQRTRDDLAGLHLYGDPTVDLFIGRPTNLRAELPESYNVGATGWSINVTDDGGTPVEDVTVCIRQPANFQYVAWTDAQGKAAFTIPEGLAEGDLQITAHKHNCRPVVADVPVVAPEVNLVLDATGFDDSETGDGDGLLRNGETARLILRLRNDGNQEAADVIASLSADSPYLEFSDSELEFGDIAAGGASDYQGDASITVAASCPGGTAISIQVTARSGEAAWASGFELSTSGPAFEVVADEIRTEQFIPGSTEAGLGVGIKNVGDLAASNIEARLRRLDSLVTVTDGTRAYPDLEPGESGSAESLFRVAVSSFAFRGDSIRFALEITVDGNFAALSEFSTRVEGELEGEPLGPDANHYICYDSGDERFIRAPIFHWREINWDVWDWEFNGSRLDLGDLTGDPGAWNQTAAVASPINFRYYGQSADSFYICSNGWIALRPSPNDTVNYTSGSNRPIPGFGAPDAQICVYWDDLRNPFNSYNGVFYHHIEEEGIFVVEWRELEVSASDSLFVTFQALLFDADLHPTPTGDSEIILQYQTFNSALGEDKTAPFATVGLRNWDGSGGLQYTFGNEYPEAAHPLADGMALKFTTVVGQYGALRGRVVRSEAQEEGIAGATLTHPRFGMLRITGNDGTFLLDGLLRGHYGNIAVSASGFNRASFSVDIVEGDTIDAGLTTLTHPAIGELGMYPLAFDSLSLRPDGSELLATLTITNEGNGSLDYRARMVNYDGSEPMPLAAGEIDTLFSITRDVWHFGLTYADSLFYIPGKSRGLPFDIYAVSLDGRPISSFDQPLLELSRSGILNLAWDGEALWGSYKVRNINTQRLVKFTREGARLKEMELPFSDPNSFPIVFNPDRGTIYAGDATLDYIVEIDTASGSPLDSIPFHLSGRRVRVSGLALNPYDTDGFNLYLLEDSSANDLSYAVLYKMNLNTGELIRVGLLEGREIPNGAHQGLAVMRDYSRTRTVLATVEDDGQTVLADSASSSDMIRFYDVGPNLALLTERGIRNGSGSIPADESGRIEFLMSADGWPEDEYQFGLQMLHSAAGETLLVPVTLTLNGNSDIPPSSVLPPDEFGLAAIYPNPFNGQVRIDFNVEALRAVSLKIYDLMGREAATIYEGETAAGRHRTVWNGNDFASGVYIIRLESGGRVHTAKLALIK